MSDLVRGVEVLSIDDGSRPIETVRTAVVGVVSAAARGPVNTPTLVVGEKEPFEKFGKGGPFADAFETILKQAGVVAVVVNVLDPTNPAHATTVTDEDLSAGHSAGSVISLANADLCSFTSLVKDPAGTPVTLVEGTDYTVDLDDGTITLTAGTSVVTGDTLAASYIAANFAGVTDDDYAGTLADHTGVYALIKAEAITQVKPRILVSSGNHFKDMATTPAITTITAALGVVASRLRGFVYLDGPNLTYQDALNAANLPSGERKRFLLIDPKSDFGDGDTPSSFTYAGLRVKLDNEKGFWWSISNQEISGIVGTSRPVDFEFGDPACEADVLAGAHISTIVNKGGWRTWGGRTLDTVDPRWRFESTVRVDDMIAESIQQNHLWAVDRPVNKTFFELVLGGVRAYLRHLKAQGAILGGDTWADPTLNTPESIALGHTFIDYEFTDPKPAEKTTFRAHLVNKYIVDIFPVS